MATVRWGSELGLGFGHERETIESPPDGGSGDGGWWLSGGGSDDGEGFVRGEI